MKSNDETQEEYDARMTGRFNDWAFSVFKGVTYFFGILVWASFVGDWISSLWHKFFP